MVERRVIVELRYSASLHEAAGVVSPSATGAKLEAQVSTLVPGFDVDPSYPPVELPATVRTTAPSGPRDVGALFALDPDVTHSTYLLRGTVDEGQIGAMAAAAGGDADFVGVFADVTVQSCLICPGAPPKGTDSDVERLLCVPALHAAAMDGSGVLVAIVDTGVNMAFLHSRGKNPTFDPARSWVPDPQLVPGSLPVGHGTMCAYDACIAAPRCTLLDIALLQSARPGGSIMEGFLSDAVLAYRHLLDIMLAPKRPGEGRSLVVNNSWGMFHPSWDFPVGHPGNYSDNSDHPFNRIVGALERAGADILFAAGNCGQDCPDGRCKGVTANAIYGANSHPLVLSVAGIDVSKTRVGYSSVGPGRLEQRKPDLSSYTHFKGSGVYAADGGTSAATPVVAGVVAALRTVMPYDDSKAQTTPAPVRRMLIKTAEDRGMLGYDYEYGWGIVNGCRLAEEHKKDDECESCLECCRKCCCPDGDLPDLVPVPNEDGSYCQRDGRELTVRVCNRGTGPAGPSTTTVDFGSHGRIDVPTPALGAGDCTDLAVTLPSGCFDPDCEFRIIVDSTGVVAESDETNNVVSGICQG